MSDEPSPRTEPDPDTVFTGTGLESSAPDGATAEEPTPRTEPGRDGVAATDPVPEADLAPARERTPGARSDVAPGTGADAEPADTAEPVPAAPPGEPAGTAADSGATVPVRAAVPGPAVPRPTGWRALALSLRPSRSRSQLLAGLLCALLGFALVVQVSANRGDDLSSLRQSELVRILDEVTQRSHSLEDQVGELEDTRDDLQSGVDGEHAALELAEQQATTEGILAGRLPASGPGIEITLLEGGQALPAATMFNILEELRNAGAEAVQVNDVRLVASSYFERTDDGLVVDGQVITSPFRWTAIGDPSTMETALEIPGGAMASVRNKEAQETIRQLDDVTVSVTREPSDPQFAKPVPVTSGS